MKIKDQGLTLRQKRIIGASATVLFLLFCAAVSWYIGRPIIEFVSEPEKFRVWVENGGIWSKIAFIGMVMFQVVIALVPGEPLEIGAGYAFGAIEGTLLTVIGVTFGSLVVFSLVRKFGVMLVEIFFSREKISSLKFLQKSKKRDFVIFLLFFLPGTPKDLITYFAGLTDMKLSYMLWLSAVVRLPSVITSTLGGDALGTEKYIMAIIVFIITLIISFIGWLIFKFISSHRKGA
ncbi:MAG: TVP38/TMEM64 family protein [Clostridia bacterium]|nr:TVP38/TMEM64 family protein [Clostridia bacterium]